MKIARISPTCSSSIARAWLGQATPMKCQDRDSREGPGSVQNTVNLDLIEDLSICSDDLLSVDDETYAIIDAHPDDDDLSYGVLSAVRGLQEQHGGSSSMSTSKDLRKGCSDLEKFFNSLSQKKKRVSNADESLVDGLSTDLSFVTMSTYFSCTDGSLSLKNNQNVNTQWALQNSKKALHKSVFPLKHDLLQVKVIDESYADSPDTNSTAPFYSLCSTRTRTRTRTMATDSDREPRPKMNFLLRWILRSFRRIKKILDQRQKSDLPAGMWGCLLPVV